MGSTTCHCASEEHIYRNLHLWKTTSMQKIITGSGIDLQQPHSCQREGDHPCFEGFLCVGILT